MKKTISLILVTLIFGITAAAYDFPEPDWGALLDERRTMSSETDFELYAEGSTELAPYYGARLEPRTGTYLGMLYEYSELFTPLGSYLTYMEASNKQTELYTPSVMKEDAAIMIGWNINSLSDVDYDYIRKALDKLNSYNRPVYIRFASEMNCSELGDDPELYVQVFRNVADIIHEYPNFAVVWSPIDIGALDRPFEYYYPGDEYVDWVGVSCYSIMYFMNDKNTEDKNAAYFMTGKYAWATNKLKPLMEFMSRNNINKPVMLSESGVARYNSFGDDYTGWHEPRLRNMLWNLIMKYPQIKMINYFNNPFDNHSLGDYGEQFYISDYPESVSIFREAAAGGAYLLSENDTPEFVFAPANIAGTLVAENGIVNLYTLAYIPDQPDIKVTYRIDGEWFHESGEIPYKCMMDLSKISDGKHILTISSGSVSKNYDMYKSGQYISFGKAIDIPEKEITVILDGSAISFDQPPVIIEDRTMVPIRAIFEAMGYTVEWNEAAGKAYAKKSGSSITVQLGSRIIDYSRDGRAGRYECDVMPQIISDRILVPVRAIAESAGCYVDWNGNTRQVIITTG